MLRPMAAGDGLIVRLRLVCGILPAATAGALADLAERHGNGRLDLTARAGLQLRGVGEAALPALVAALRDLGLVDADAGAEAVRNVIASPLAGLQAGPDIRPLVAALDARLAATPALHALPGKFGFLVDDGGAPSLAGVAADVRFDWTGAAFAIGLGGSRASAIDHGSCAFDDLVDHAEEIARAAIALFARVPDARRMRALVAALGVETLRESFGKALPSLRCGMRINPPDDAERLPSRKGEKKLATGIKESSNVFAVAEDGGGSRPADTVYLAPPYGRLDAGMLRVAASLAETGELRLTPWRSLLLPGAAASARAPARAAGFIVEPDDPRLAISACVGAPECARATTATRADADALADLAAALGGAGPRLHVSGCAKGCALAAPAPVTLVGRDGRYDLVVGGRADAPPVRRGLAIEDVCAALASLTS